MKEKYAPLSHIAKVVHITVTFYMHTYILNENVCWRYLLVFL